MLDSELFMKKFQFENLESVYNLKISHKANPGLDRMNRSSFERNKEENIKIITRKVYGGSYKFTLYKEKLLLKGRGKLPRVISIPTIRDKITLSVVNEILTELYSNEIKGKLTQSIIDEIKTAVKSGEYDYFIKLDIRNFYDNINHTILLNKIKKKVKQNELLDIIKKAIETPTVTEGKRNIEPEIPKVGVPQGISISNILANIYLMEMDKKISSFRGIKYFRYVDDILILCKSSNMKRTQNSLRNELCTKLLLSFNDKKNEGPILQGFDYLGYHYTRIKENFYGFSVRTSNLLKLESSIINTFTDYKKSKNSYQFIWNINNRITGFILDDNKYGWLFFYSQIDNVAILYHLDWFVRKMCGIYNIDSKIQVRIKRFVKAYFEIIKRRGKSGYIPNSKEFSTEEKKRTLRYIFEFKKSDLDRMSMEEIEIAFKRKLYVSVKELEKDVQSFS